MMARWLAMIFLWLVAVESVGAIRIEPIDCLVNEKHPQCSEVVGQMASCLDYMKAGHQRTGPYPFPYRINDQKTEVRKLYCEFDDEKSTAATIVHNGLERRVFDFPLGKTEAWHIDYEVDHMFVHHLALNSAQCEQEIRFTDCRSYESLKSALRNGSIILLSAHDKNISEPNMSTWVNCHDSKLSSTLPTGILSLGVRNDMKASIAFSLGPLKCQGSKHEVDEEKNCNAFNSHSTESIVEFNFRTLERDFELIGLTSGKQLSVSIEKGWLLMLKDPLDTSAPVTEYLLPNMVSDGEWHKFRFRIADSSKIFLSMDAAVLELHDLKFGNFSVTSGAVIRTEKDICIADFKIDNRRMCSADKSKRSMCEKTQSCTSVGNQVCIPGSRECNGKASSDCIVGNTQHTVTFSENQKGFVWSSDDLHTMEMSVYFKTMKPTSLLVYHQHMQGQFFQVSILNGSIAGFMCNRTTGQQADVQCDMCSIGKDGGFNDLTWHHVQIERFNPDSGIDGAFLFTDSGACRLRSFNIHTNLEIVKHLVISKADLKTPNTYFGGIPVEAHLAEERGPLSDQFKHERLENDHFAGCMAFLDAKGRLDETQRHIKKDAFTVTPGCDSSGGDCSSCGKNIPCTIDQSSDRSSSSGVICNCTSQFMIKQPGQTGCQRPRLFQSLESADRSSCVIADDVPLEPQKDYPDFHTLWFTFRFLGGQSTVQKISLVYTSTSKGEQTILDVEFHLNAQKMDILSQSDDKIICNMPAALINTTHFFSIRRIVGKVFEAQIDNQRTRFSNSELSSKEEIRLIARQNQHLCISEFVVKFSTNENVHPRFIEVDGLFQFHDVSRRIETSPIDRSTIFYELPYMDVQKTEYPPKAITDRRESKSEKGGFQLWMIAIIVGIILVLVFAALLLLYFRRRRRSSSRRREKSRHHEVPTSSPDLDSHRRREFDDEDFDDEIVFSRPRKARQQKNANNNNRSSDIESHSSLPPLLLPKDLQRIPTKVSDPIPAVVVTTPGADSTTKTAPSGRPFSYSQAMHSTNGVK